MMTEREDDFIINGAERVVVSQLHRSPGVFFAESLHPNDKTIFSGRVIPFRGSWVEFTTDINNVLWAYIDREKEIPGHDAPVCARSDGPAMKISSSFSASFRISTLGPPILKSGWASSLLLM